MSVSHSRDTSSMLSVAMIVRDAADLLDATIDSIRAIADEIVVLDTGSQDETVQVAQKAGAVVFETAWDDNFAEARNECAAHATGDWVLWLDAGETLGEETAEQIRNFVSRDSQSNKAYMLFVQTPPTNRQLSGEQIGQIRLVPRRSDVQFEGQLRETMLPSVLAAGMEVDALPCQIHRCAAIHNPAIKEAKANRNMQILDRAEKEDAIQDASAMMLARAEAYQNLDQRDEASRAYREAVDAADQGSSAMLEAYYGLLTTYDGCPEHAETQIATCLEALDVYPLDAQLLCGMGSYLLNQKRLDLAARSYEIAATHGQIDPTTWHLEDIAEVASNCLSLTHQLRGDVDEAIAVLERALEQRPESLRLRNQLLELLVKNTRRNEAMATFEAMPRDVPNREALRSAVRGALLAAEKNYLAAEPYLKTAFSAGCRETLCMRWLAVTYLSTGSLEAAEPVIAQWRAIDPLDAEAIAYQKAIAVRRDSDVPSLATMPTGVAPVQAGQPAHPVPADQPPAAARPSGAPRRVVRVDEPSAGGPADRGPAVVPMTTPASMTDPGPPASF